MTRLGNIFDHHGGLQGGARRGSESKHSVVRQEHRGSLLTHILNNGFANMIRTIIHIRKAGYLFAELICDGRQIDGKGLSQ